MIRHTNKEKELFDLLVKLYEPAQIAVNQIICMGGDETCQPCENREKLAEVLEEVERVIIQNKNIYENFIKI